MKKQSTFLVLILLAMSLSSSATMASVQPDASYTDWYLAGDEAVGFRITHLMYNGSIQPIPVNGYNDGDNGPISVNGFLNEGDAIAFFTPESYPDWENGSASLNLTMRYDGGVGDMYSQFSYSLPSISDPSTVALDGPPAMMWPMIPFGDDAYYQALTSEFELKGYTVASDSSYLGLTFTNATYNAATYFEKSTGLLYNYTYTGITKAEAGTTVPFEISFEQDFVLSPSHADSSDFFTTSPILTYEVTHASAAGGNGLDFGGLISDGSGMMGYGRTEVGDIISINFGDFRNSFDEGIGYTFELNDLDTNGYLSLNTSIDLPRVDPGENGAFLYPMFPLVGADLIHGYLSMADIANGAYDWSITTDAFEISFVTENITLQVSWDMSNGVMQSFYLNQTTDQVILGLQLITAEDVNSLDLGYGVAAGDTLFLHAAQIMVNGTNQIDTDTGFVTQGDTVTFTVAEVSTTNGPQLNADILGPNVDEKNVNFTQAFPGTLQGGPPLFTPFYLTGNAEFYNFLQTMYEFRGATFDASGSTVHIDWIVNFDDGSVANISVSFDKATGKLIHYYADYQAANSAESFTVEFVQVDSADFVASTDSSSSNIGISPFNPVGFVFGFIITTYMARRLRYT